LYCVKAQISEAKAALAEITRENTERQVRVGDLLERNIKLEQALNATQGRMVPRLAQASVGTYGFDRLWMSAQVDSGKIRRIGSALCNKFVCKLNKLRRYEPKFRFSVTKVRCSLRECELSNYCRRACIYACRGAELMPIYCHHWFCKYYFYSGRSWSGEM